MNCLYNMNYIYKHNFVTEILLKIRTWCSCRRLVVLRKKKMLKHPSKRSPQDLVTNATAPTMKQSAHILKVNLARNILMHSLCTKKKSERKIVTAAVKTAMLKLRIVTNPCF